MKTDNGIRAEIIADSKFENSRLTTFVLRFPRIVLAEFNTHRVVSRNSASSRAIPFKKMLKLVKEDPFVPIAFQKDHKGMQGTEYLESEALLDAQESWLKARDVAVEQAEVLNTKDKVTKQLCNRLLEPFMFHTVIATASNWENFFALRAHDAAEIHIADLAYKMLDAYNANEPENLGEGGWHVPFSKKLDNDKIWDLAVQGNKKIGIMEGLVRQRDLKLKIATARCARVSYLNYEGKDDYEADLKLYNRLSEMGHWSPFEHCAQACFKVEDTEKSNFDGCWLQLRKTFENENKSDSRVK